MASTFSTNLRLELQGTGDNNATWGSKANNVFEMIEDAVSGYVTVAMTDANMTLSAQPGTVDQSRNMMIRFTGTLTANRTVTIPAVSKTYLMHNATTGPFSVILKLQDSSVTYELMHGPTVGQWKYVYTNSVDFFTNDNWITLSSQAKRWGIPAYVSPATDITQPGIMDIGSGIDFHNTDTDANNFSVRLGTASGPSTFSTTDLYIIPASGSPNKVWNSGNDGVGSTLDADMVDGLHASAFQLAGTLPAEVVTLTGTQTLTNKTLTSPAISNPTLTGTVTGNGTFTGGVSGTTGTFTTSISAVSGNMAMAASTGIRYFQYETGYYWEFNTSTKLLRWMRGGVEEFHIGDSGITATARVFSEDGHFVATGVDGFLASTGTSLAGAVRLRPRGMDSSTFQALLSSVDGTFTVTNVSETSDETLKSNWTPVTKSVVNEVAALEIGSFRWKDTGTGGYGVKAQALRVIMPDVVHEGEGGLLGVSYGKAALTAIIDASKRIVALEARLAELEARMA